MSPRELMLAAIRHRPLPAMAAATYNFHPFAGFAEEPEYAPMLEAVAAAPNVGMVCKTGPSRRRARHAVITSEKRADDRGVETITRWATPAGELTTIHRQPHGQPGYTIKHLLETDEDVEKYLSVPVEPDQVDMSPVLEACRRIGDQGLAYVAYTDPFYAIASQFDFEEFTVMCLQRTEEVRMLVDREFDRVKVELAAMLRQVEGDELLFYTAGPEVATPPMLPPRLFAELVTPYHVELVGMMHEAGQLVSIHCHGRVRMVLDQFLEMGADVLEPMEPPPQGDIALEEALDYVDGRICLMGYIQDQDLYTAAPGQMRAKVQAIREIVAGRTGYLMTPTATPYMHPPPPAFVRNYVEFVEAAAEPLP